MSKRISRKAALVTGASKRIGRAIALSLAKEGYDIVLHYNTSAKEAIKTAKEIERSDVKVIPLAADLEDESQALGLLDRAVREFPYLNVLINSASIFTPSEFHTRDIEHFHHNWQLHVQAPYIMTAEFQRLCTKGNVINILDTHITDAQTPHFAYLLSKKALAELTKMSAISLAPNIRVNGVCPGLILPPEGEGEAYLKSRATKIPLQKKGSPENVTHAVRFLLDNDFVTGQFLYVDGGEHLI